jgi:hypothetical protein
VTSAPRNDTFGFLVGCGYATPCSP